MENNVVNLDTKRRPSLTNEVAVKASSLTSSIKVPQLGLKGTIKLEENLENMAEPYSQTEIDIKFDLVNQKIEHNQKTMELILSNGLNEIKSQIKSELDVFKSDINGEVKSIRSDIKSELGVFKSDIQGEVKSIRQETSNLKWVIGGIIVPFALMIAPLVIQIINSM
jgi:gas vesicle protein